MRQPPNSPTSETSVTDDPPGRETAPGAPVPPASRTRRCASVRSSLPRTHSKRPARPDRLPQARSRVPSPPTAQGRSGRRPRRRRLDRCVPFRRNLDRDAPFRRKLDRHAPSRRKLDSHAPRPRKRDKCAPCRRRESCRLGENPIRRCQNAWSMASLPCRLRRNVPSPGGPRRAARAMRLNQIASTCRRSDGVPSARGIRWWSPATQSSRYS